MRSCNVESKRLTHQLMNYSLSLISISVPWATKSFQPKCDLDYNENKVKYLFYGLFRCSTSAYAYGSLTWQSYPGVRGVQGVPVDRLVRVHQ